MSAFPIPKNLLLTQLCAIGPDTLDWRDCGIVFRVQTLSAGPSSSHWQLDFTEQFWGEVLAHHAVCTSQLDSQHWGPSLPFPCVVGVLGMGRGTLADTWGPGALYSREEGTRPALLHPSSRAGDCPLTAEGPGELYWTSVGPAFMPTGCPGEQGSQRPPLQPPQHLGGWGTCKP